MVDLSALMRDILGSVALPSKVRLCSTIEDGLLVRAVSGELRQVVLNLLLNAAHFTPPEGDVQFTLESRDGYARISVKDDGPGISVASRAQIFQPFYTTRSNGGTGVGLWVSRELVERVGGTLTFLSMPEIAKGTEFIVLLPLLDARP